MSIIKIKERYNWLILKAELYGLTEDEKEWSIWAKTQINIHREKTKLHEVLK